MSKRNRDNRTATPDQEKSPDLQRSQQKKVKKNNESEKSENKQQKKVTIKIQKDSNPSAKHSAATHAKTKKTIQKNPSTKNQKAEGKMKGKAATNQTNYQKIQKTGKKGSARDKDEEEEKEEEKEEEEEKEKEEEEDDQVSKLIELLENEKNLKTIYKSRSPLTKELFVTGIDLQKLTPNNIQERFKATLTDGRIVFYPTALTSEIFRTIRKKKGRAFYLYSCTGTGKSFSLALFVYLMRQKSENIRVLYIHNGVHFAGNPHPYLVKELRHAFSQDLPKIGIKESELDKISKTAQTDALKTLMNRIFSALDKQSREIYIVIDQVNAIENAKSSPAYELYLQLKAPDLTKFTNVLMISATNEVLDKPEQETPKYPLKFEKPFIEVQKKFIAERFDLNLNNSQDKESYEEIQALSDGYFLITNELAENFNKQTPKESMAAFLLDKTDKVEADMQKYLDAKQESDQRKRGELVAKRRETLMLAIDSIVNNTNFTGSKLSMYLDLRFFVLLANNQKLRPLHPVVISAAKQILSDMDIMKTLIEKFQDNPSVLGFILEKLILMSLPKTGSGTFTLHPFKTGAKTGQIDFARKQIHFLPTPNDFDLVDEGLYCPLAYNFAQYDGFMNLNEIYAFQIKLKFTQKKVKELSLIRNQKRAKVGNTKQYVRYRLKELATQKDKPINTVLISIGQDFRKGNEFAKLRTLKQEDGFSFFYVDATNILKNLGFEDRFVNIMKKSKSSDENE